MEQFARLVPDDPIAHYNLGALYKVTGKPEEALREFRKASELDPALAAAHFQLYNAYRTGGIGSRHRRNSRYFSSSRSSQRARRFPRMSNGTPGQRSWTSWRIGPRLSLRLQLDSIRNA